MRQIAPLCVALGVAAALLFAGLFAAPGALADSSTEGEVASAAEQALPPAEGEASASEEPVASSTEPATIEPAPAPASEPSPPAEAPPAEAPATEAPPADTPPAEAPPAEAPPAEAPPAETPPAEAPPAEAPPAAAEEPPPAPPVIEAPIPPEQAPAPEAPAPAELPGGVVEQEKKNTGEGTTEMPADQETPATSGLSTLTPSTPVGPAGVPGEVPEISTALWPTGLPVTTPPGSPSKRGAGPASCGLAALIESSCAGGLLSLSSQPANSSVLLIASGSFPAQLTPGTATDVTRRGTPPQNPPSAPTQGPEPGGSGGISAACGGASSACPALTSAGLNLPYSQITTRALLVAQPSWRTSFFVLVPERPG